MDLLTLEKRFENLAKSFELLQKENLALKKENAFLKKELAKYQTTKTSSNSSIPPSKDENRVKKNQSLRIPSDKKVGGQKGREGKTLEMSSTPDEIITLYPDFCKGCGSSLDDFSASLSQVRQCVDIPPLQAIFTEYRTFSKTCTCGCRTVSDFPKEVSSPISYGSRIEGLIAYFHARQYLPFARMEEMFNKVFNIAISEGGIHYLLKRFANKTSAIYQSIKEEVEKSDVVGSDETGGKVNGKRHWFWTWQTPKLTFITHSDNRAGDTIRTHFPNGFPTSTLVHDGWKPQLNTEAKYHQSCLSHLQRTLKYLNERYPNSQWGADFIKLLYAALELKRGMSSEEYKLDFTPRNQIIEQFEKLLATPPNIDDKELYTFYKRIGREKEFIFTFLKIEEVPPDNNASERAVRNIKVKQKVSGQFKIEEAAQNFAKIRSIIDTAIKNGLDVVETLCLIAKYQHNTKTD